MKTDDCNESVEAGFGAAALFGNWQPIDTAPKTERILLCIGGEDWAIGSWNKDAFDGPQWEDDSLEPVAFIVQPTHWMPLPHLPPWSKWPNDPSSPTAKSQVGNQDGQMSRSVQRLVRLPVTPQHTHTELPALETPEIKFAPIRVPLALQNGPHWHRPEGIHSIQTEVWNLAWLLDKLGITDEQVVHSLRQISGYVSYLEGRSQPNDQAQRPRTKGDGLETEA